MADEGDASPVQRSDEGRDGPVQKLDSLPIEMAKAQIGSAIRDSLPRGASLKEFGDPSQVNRLCDGDVNSILARVWARPDTRRKLVMALADASGFFEARVTLNERKTGT